MNTITAHCLIKNEENFVGYAIKSVIDFVDSIIVFDTGSTDKTVEIIQNLAKEYPNKIIFEEKGICDKARHTRLRQEMVERTKTDWFMILDGDEVWPQRTLVEAKEAMNKGVYDGIQIRFYECVGDIYHRHRKESYITARFVKMGDMRWGGDYEQDTYYTKNGAEFLKTKNMYLAQNKFWHLTHLERSSKDGEDYSSGGKRVNKRILTYFMLGVKVNEPIPEVFNQDSAKFKLSWSVSFINFFKLLIFKIKTI